MIESGLFVFFIGSMSAYGSAYGVLSPEEEVREKIGKLSPYFTAMAAMGLAVSALGGTLVGVVAAVGAAFLAGGLKSPKASGKRRTCMVVGYATGYVGVAILIAHLASA